MMSTKKNHRTYETSHDKRVKYNHDKCYLDIGELPKSLPSTEKELKLKQMATKLIGIDAEFLFVQTIQEPQDIMIVSTTKTTIPSIVERLNGLEGKVEELETKYDFVVERLSARQFANVANKKALKMVFPKCCKKPYAIWSFKNLVEFIKNPKKAEKNGLCLPEASDKWYEKTEEERYEIEEKVRKVQREFPQLIHSINLLKDYDSIAHKMTTIEQGISYFRKCNENAAADALSLCNEFIK